MEPLSGGIRWIDEVHPQVLFCRGGAVIQIMRGSGKLREVYSDDKWRRWCRVQLEDRSLYVTNTDHCSSYRDTIHLGYGDGANEVLQASVERVNGPYSKLRDAVDAIHLMLNLLERGTYFIGDFDLFPVQKDGEKLCCFWDLPQRDKYGYWPYAEWSEWAGGTYPMNDQPLYLVPTQRAKTMDPERVKHYTRWLNDDPDHIPRAIGLYLRGSGVLLLDGHHKALAAAATGVPVKTLVICRVNDENALLSAAAGGKRLFLRNNRMRVCDHEETFRSDFYWIAEERKPKLTSPIIPEDPDEDDWGRIDERWIVEMKQPRLMVADTLRNGLKLPCHSIKGLITGLQKLPPDELTERENSKSLEMLRDYLALSPESKWITPAQRQWLNDLKDKYWI